MKYMLQVIGFADATFAEGEGPTAPALPARRPSGHQELTRRAQQWRPQRLSHKRIG